MKQKDFENIVELTYVGGGWIPANAKAEEIADRCHKGEVISFLEVTQRDLKFHKCYMDLLSFIYDYLPAKFKNKVPKNKFYVFLKHLQGKYEVTYSFKDGTKMIEYESISFGKMSQKRFEEFIAEQLPFIFENVIGAYFEGEMYKSIIATIEQEYQNFLRKI